MDPTAVPIDDLSGLIERRAEGAGRFVVGITGAPGSGKSTLAARLSADLGAPVVTMDGFHRSNRVLDRLGLRHVKGAPQTFAADDFVRAVSSLRAAERVVLPDFDRIADEPRPAQVTVESDERIVLVEGNYLLLDRPPWDGLVDLFDLVVHVDLDHDRRVERLVARHVHYGMAHDDAVAFAAGSDETNARIVDSMRHRADVVVQGS